MMEALQNPGAMENSMKCPECSSTIAVHYGYISWCDNCGWNAEGSTPNQPKTLYEKVYDDLGKRLGKKLLVDLLSEEKKRNSIWGTRILSYLLTSIVYFVAATLFLSGLDILFRGGKNIFFYITGFILLSLAWMARPRINQIQGKVVSKTQYKSLYRLADQVAEAIHAPKVDGIIIDENYNAYFTKVGLRQKRILCIGLPLFEVLEKDEKIALLAHELGHSANKDISRSFFVGTAIGTLQNWREVLDSRDLFQYNLLFLIVSSPYILITFIMVKIIDLFIYSLSHLLWRDSQYAEYAADLKAAEISGSNAAIKLLNKLVYTDTYNNVVQKVALSSIRMNLFDELASCMKKMPKKELDRIRYLEEKLEVRLDATHPPTIFRVEYLEKKNIENKKLEVDDQLIIEIEKELNGIKAETQRILSENYRLLIS